MRKGVGKMCVSERERERAVGKKRTNKEKTKTESL